MEPGVHSISRFASRMVTVSVEMDGESFEVNVPRRTTVTQLIDLALKKRPSSKVEKRLFVYDGRILTTGTLGENSVGNNTVVRLELERTSTVCFTYHAQDRKINFSLPVENTMTTREVKEALAREMSSGYRPIDMTGKTIRISKEWIELPDDSHPALSDDISYTVHVLPRSESWIPFYVNYTGSSSNNLNDGKKFLVFAPQQSTADCLREEIAKVAFCAPECLEVKLSRSGKEDEVHQSDDDIGDSGVDSDEEDEAVEMPRRRKMDVVRARASSLIDIGVQVSSDASSEVTELRLKVYEHNTTDIVLQRVAKAMAEDSKRVRLFHRNKMVQPEKTLRDYSLHGDAMFTANIFARGAVLDIRHSQEIFKYSLFVVDPAGVTSAELQHFVEKKHKFCQNSVDLYHEHVRLTAESPLQDMGIGMNATLVVCTKNPENAPNRYKTQRRSVTRIFELDSEISFESCSAPQDFKWCAKTPGREGHRKASSKERHESRAPMSKSKVQHRWSQRKKRKAEGSFPDQLAGDGKPAASHSEKLHCTNKADGVGNKAARTIPLRCFSSHPPKQLPKAKGNEQRPQCRSVQQTPRRGKVDLPVYNNNCQGLAHLSREQPKQGGLFSTKRNKAQDPTASGGERVDGIHQTGQRKKTDRDSFHVDETTALYGHGHDDVDETDNADVQEDRGGDVGRGKRKPSSQKQSVSESQESSTAPMCRTTPYGPLSPWLGETSMRINQQQNDEMDSANIERTIETKTIQKGNRIVARRLTISEFDPAFAIDPNGANPIGHDFSAIQNEASSAPLLLEEPPGVIKDKMLREIAERLGNDWTSLCINLDVPAAEISSIQHDVKLLSNQAFEGLQRWKKIKGREATPAALKTALQDKDLKSLADMIPEEATIDQED